MDKVGHVIHLVNMYKELDADESELTRTRKLRRSFVENRYNDLIEMVYGDRDKWDVKTSVTYQDGRTGMLETQVIVKTVME